MIAIEVVLIIVLTFSICQIITHTCHRQTFAPDHIVSVSSSPFDGQPLLFKCKRALDGTLVQIARAAARRVETITWHCSTNCNTTGHYHFQLWPSRDSLSLSFFIFYFTCHFFPPPLTMFFETLICQNCLKLWLKIFSFLKFCAPNCVSILWVVIVVVKLWKMIDGLRWWWQVKLHFSHSRSQYSPQIDPIVIAHLLRIALPAYFHWFDQHAAQQKVECPWKWEHIHKRKWGWIYAVCSKCNKYVPG